MIEQIFTASFLIGVLASTIRMATPIIITALGEMIAERSGVMNLGIEGIMILGAFTSFTVAYFSGNLWYGLLFGGLAGALLGLVMAVLSVRFKANQIVAGLGIWIFCQGFSSLINRRIFGIVDTRPTIATFPQIPIPGLSNIPILGEVLFNQNIIIYFVYVLVFLLDWFFNKTSWGLNIDAVGEHPAAADAAGLNVSWVRILSVIAGGALAGLGGSYLSVSLYGLYTDDLSVGLGWMAIAVVVFGKWRPFHILGAALIFGAANALQFRLQSMNFPLPYHFTLMLPFIITIVIVILFVRGEAGPTALTKPYDRSEGS